MSSLDFENVYSYFLGNVSDYDFINISDSDYNDLMSEYLQRAVADYYVNSLFSSISVDPDLEEITYEMANPVNSSIDSNFVTEIIAKSMVIKWLEPQVRSRINTAQVFGTKEEKFFSQAQHLSELRGLLEDTKLDVRRLIRDRSFIHNSYLE